ncbi:MAG: response regulator [Proteobacteria bacterium]|nr:response regulator [Pseudomonadota bacterium]
MGDPVSTQAPSSRILLVDDDAAVREHIATALSDEFVIDTAHDGIQALKHLLRNRPDVIATDIVMPELDGIEFLKTLRGTPSMRLIPVLLISGHAPDELRVEGFEQGADGYLAKPYTLRELRARLRTMVQAARDRAEASRREALEQAEREAVAERATLLESITDPFYALDQDFRFTYINQRAVDYFQRPREQLLGRSLWELFPETAGSRFEMEFRRALLQRRPSEFEALSPISQRWIEVHLYPTPRGVAINFRDITARMQVAEALRESEAARSAGELRQREAAQRDAIRVRLADALRPLRDPAEIESTANQILRDHLQASQVSYVSEPDGPPRMQVEMAQVRDWTPEEAAFIQEFAERITAALERVRIEAQIRDANRRKDEFLATLAHELRNPLAPLRGAVHLLKRSDLTPGHADRAREIMDRQINHMVRLVDDLLDVSRINVGQVNLRNEIVALNTVVLDAVEAARVSIEEGAHSLDVAVCDEPVLLEGDGTRLVQVLQNLLNNAAKYTPAGGRIQINAARSGAEAVISVRDNGPGIPPEAQERIFELFTRVHPSDSIKVSGLGIGLSLARKLVELHNGRIEVSSEGAGRGSEFRVYLPVLQAPADAVLLGAPEGHKRVAGCRVLVVDDNQDAADSVSMLLALDGFETRVAYDGAQAIKEFAQYRPDALLLDIGMPIMDGYEVARRIRADAHGRGTVLCALTGWGQAQDKQRALDAGFDEHLTKPVDPSTLADLLSTAIRRRNVKLP